MHNDEPKVDGQGHRVLPLYERTYQRPPKPKRDRVIVWIVAGAVLIVLAYVVMTAAMLNSIG